MTSNLEADKVTSQRKIWQNESEIGCAQLIGEEQRKICDLRAGRERKKEGEWCVVGRMCVGQFYQDSFTETGYRRNKLYTCQQN